MKGFTKIKPISLRFFTLLFEYLRIEVAIETNIEQVVEYNEQDVIQTRNKQNWNIKNYLEWQKKVWIMKINESLSSIQ